MIKLNLGQIIDRVRKTIGESTRNVIEGNSTWTDQQIAGYVNEAIGLLANDYRKDSYAILDTFIDASGTNGVSTLPDDCLEDGLRKLTYNTAISSYPMKYLTIDQFLQLKSNILIPTSSIYNNQRYYTVWANSDGVEEIQFYPIPQTGDTIEIYYYRKLIPLQVLDGTGTYLDAILNDNTPVFQTTATGSKNSTSITVASNANFIVGQKVFGTGISANAAVQNIAGTTITLTQANYYGVNNTIYFSTSAYNQTPDIPTRMHIALVEYAIRECQNAVEELTLSSYAGNKFEILRRQFVEEQYRNQRDQGIRARARGANR